MAGINLEPFQQKALDELKNGSILQGGVGSGKSITSLAYYYKLNGGKFETINFVPMKNPCDLYIITIAKKRDDREWEIELSRFLMSTDPELNYYKNKIVVDSWQNIAKYTNVKNSFFIFDEQKVSGGGKWSKAFIQIAKANKWIILSATPGDKWEDYRSIFVANGFFRNVTEFNREHCVYSRYTNYPSIINYMNEGLLNKYKHDITVYMERTKNTNRIDIQIPVSYNEVEYKYIQKNRWNIFTNEPIKNASEYCFTLRKSVNRHISRQDAVRLILERHKKAIIFYSYDYELDILHNLLNKMEYTYTEWNGHKHQSVPTGEEWAYLVEYAAGAEAWNCITTDTMIFFSLNYSYRTVEQAKGRIDRWNTPYKDLYYYSLKSSSAIDLAILKAIARKKKFNERKFAPEDIFKKEG